MTKNEIRKTLRKYYKQKWRIAICLLTSLAVVVLSAFTTSIVSILTKQGHIFTYSMAISEICAFIGVAAYFFMFVFVIRAALFPTGKYSLYDKIQRKDIVNILEYISEMDCGFNEQYDHLMVLSRTTDKMVSNIYNWGTDAEAGRLNSAWNLLDRYFKESKILNIDAYNLKEYADELLTQLNNSEINEDALTDIMRTPTSPSSFKADIKFPRLKRPISVELLLYVLCTVALIVIVLYKSFVFWLPVMEQNRLMNYVQTIGSDIIAIVFAAFSIKSCWLNIRTS